MALHPTAALSYGEPPPSYEHIDGDHLEPAVAAQLLLDGESVHVATQGQAALVLRAVGLTPDEIASRMRVAHGPGASELPDGGSPW